VTSHFRHTTSHSRFAVTLPVFEEGAFSISKNVTIFLELGTNVTISLHCHIIFLGSVWNKPGFENLARSWVTGAEFLDLGYEQPSERRRTEGDSSLT